MAEPRKIYIKCKVCKCVVTYGYYASVFQCPLCSAYDYKPTIVDKGAWLEFKRKGYRSSDLQARFWNQRAFEA